ncbi:MAG: hypothetical protein FJX77_11765, partial [Armatimonadetes bacterium]|nr:hypothetical protein [Armatimonadota bacterium]
MTHPEPLRERPILTSQGVELDGSPGAFGRLRESNDLLPDWPALRTRMAEDGYLLLRDLLDPEQVLAARGEILGKLAAVGEVDEQ